jgi:hypothetical protein
MYISSNINQLTVDPLEALRPERLWRRPPYHQNLGDASTSCPWPPPLPFPVAVAAPSTSKTIAGVVRYYCWFSLGVGGTPAEAQGGGAVRTGA